MRLRVPFRGRQRSRRLAAGRQGRAGGRVPPPEGGPVMVVHAGNRVDAAGARAPGRFPPDQVDVLRARLARLLAHVRPEVVVTAAPAGSDLLVLQEALRLGLAVHVVLPSARGAFRERSVADRGPSWTAAYDRVLDAVAA